MASKQTVEALQALKGDMIKILDDENPELFIRAKNQNNWFTPIACASAFKGIIQMLDQDELQNWLSNYDLQPQKAPKSIGVLMAGNIPAVGFHDLMCVLLSGHKAAVKLSTSDSVLMLWIIERLIEANKGLEDFICVEPMLKNKDAYIATGSDNSSRYFDYYFGKYPHIIRKNRTSIAVLNGEETEEEVLNLGKDIFTYFGLGCRNVSKIYMKDKIDLQSLLGYLETYKWVADHHKYFNNYEYNKSIYLVNKTPHLDNGFLLLKEDSQLVSPIAVLYYEVYESDEDLKNKLARDREKIQCTVGRGQNYIPFGAAQNPSVSDYADRVDTMSFLTRL